MKLNDKQHMGNLKAAMKASGPGALPATLKLAASLPEHGKGKPTKRKDLADDVRMLLWTNRRNLTFEADMHCG